jgi:hypothetical protein
MNYGGFSWRRLLGISAFKSRVSRKIGIPLTASGRRRKLGASVFNVAGTAAGTVAVAAIAATKQRKPAAPPKPSSSNGVHFFEVKGVTHNNDDGTSRIAAQQLCSIGETVKLVADPSNEHDRNAIRVVLLTGQQIGFISARQAARFQGKLQLLTATVFSRVKDEWGNETVKLRVTEQGHNAVKGLSSSDPVLVLQTEAIETGKKEGWKSTLIYFEDPDGKLYQVVLSEHTELIRRTLQEGLTRVGFIGAQDAPKGIKFGLALDESFSVTGTVAKRFMVNARDWIATRSKEVCIQNGVPAAVVHDIELSKTFTDASKSDTRLGFAIVAVLLFFVLLLIYQPWWVAAAIAALGYLVWRQETSKRKG